MAAACSIIAKSGSLETAASELPSLIQPGLFDKRAVKHHQSAEQQRRHVLANCAERTALLEASCSSGCRQAAIALVLMT